MLLESSSKEFLDEVFSLAKKRTELVNVQSIVSHVLPNWRGPGNDENPKTLSRVLQLAIKIESPELASQLVKPLGQLTISKTSVPILIELADCYGAQWCTNRKHITERVGSPHKLLLTKTDQLFKREMKLRKAYEDVLVFL